MLTVYAGKICSKSASARWKVNSFSPCWVCVLKTMKGVGGKRQEVNQCNMVNNFLQNPCRCLSQYCMMSQAVIIFCALRCIIVRPDFWKKVKTVGKH